MTPTPNNALYVSLSFGLNRLKKKYQDIHILVLSLIPRRKNAVTSLSHAATSDHENQKLDGGFNPFEKY